MGYYCLILYIRMYSNVVYRKLSLVSEWLHIVNDAPIMRASCPPPFCMTCLTCPQLSVEWASELHPPYLMGVKKDMSNTTHVHTVFILACSNFLGFFINSPMSLHTEREAKKQRSKERPPMPWWSRHPHGMDHGKPKPKLTIGSGSLHCWWHPWMTDALQDSEQMTEICAGEMSWIIGLRQPIWPICLNLSNFTPHLEYTLHNTCNSLH